MRTLKFKGRLTNGFFAAVNQMAAAFSQFTTTAEHCFVVWTVHSDLITESSAVVGSWEEPPNIWLTVAKNAFVGWTLNFRVRMLLKGAVNVDVARAPRQTPFQVFSEKRLGEISKFSWHYSSTEFYIFKRRVWVDITACKLTTTCVRHWSQKIYNFPIVSVQHCSTCFPRQPQTARTMCCIICKKVFDSDVPLYCWWIFC